MTNNTKHISFYVNIGHLASVIGTIYILDRWIHLKEHEAGFKPKTFRERIKSGIDSFIDGFKSNEPKDPTNPYVIYTKPGAVRNPYNVETREL